MRRVSTPKDGKPANAEEPKRKRSRKRDSNPDAKRSKDEEKENSLRDRHASTSPKSGTSTPQKTKVAPVPERKSPRTSPRISPRTSPRKSKSISPKKRKDDEEDRNCEVVPKKIKKIGSYTSRRKMTAPKHLDELKAVPVQASGEVELFRAFFDANQPKIATSADQFLCRNVRKSMKIKMNGSSKLLKKDRFIGTDLMRHLRVKALKSTGQRPVFTIDFVRIYNWSSPKEAEFINSVTGTSTIYWDVALVDENDEVTTYECGFADVPVFKQVEDNYTEEQIAKNYCLKFRQFTADLEKLRNLKEVFLIVEAVRFVRETTNDANGAFNRRQRAPSVFNPKPSKAKNAQESSPSGSVSPSKVGASSSNGKAKPANDTSNENVKYNTIRRIGCRRLLAAKGSFSEGVTDILLSDESALAIHLKGSSWKKDLGVLRKMDSIDHKKNSFSSRLIFSASDQRLPISAVPKKQPRPSMECLPSSSAESEEKELIATIKLVNGEQMQCRFQGFRCPATGVQFKNSRDLIAHLNARFPCFQFLANNDTGRGFSFQFTKNLDYFESSSQESIYKDFVYKKPPSENEDIIVEKGMNYEKPEQPFRWRLPKKPFKKPPLMPEHLVPCRSVRYPSVMATGDSSVLRKSKKKEEPIARKEDSDEDLMKFVPPTKTFALENARLLNEIMLRDRTPGPDLSLGLPNPKQQMQVINEQLSDDEVIEYKKLQEESSIQFAKIKATMERKKGKGYKAWKACSYGNGGPSTSQDQMSPRKLAHRTLKVSGVLDEPAANGGTHLDYFGYPIPVKGKILFPRLKVEMYNAIYREFLAAYGYGPGAHNIKTRYEMMLSFIEHFGRLLGENRLDSIFLKHLELIAMTSKEETDLLFKVFHAYRRVMYKEKVQDLE